MVGGGGGPDVDYVFQLATPKGYLTAGTTAFSDGSGVKVLPMQHGICIVTYTVSSGRTTIKSMRYILDDGSDLTTGGSSSYKFSASPKWMGAQQIGRKIYLQAIDGATTRAFIYDLDSASWTIEDTNGWILGDGSTLKMINAYIYCYAADKSRTWVYSQSAYDIDGLFDDLGGGVTGITLGYGSNIGKTIIMTSQSYELVDGAIRMANHSSVIDAWIGTRHYRNGVLVSSDEAERNGFAISDGTKSFWTASESELTDGTDVYPNFLGKTYTNENKPSRTIVRLSIGGYLLDINGQAWMLSWTSSNAAGWFSDGSGIYMMKKS